VTARSWAGEGGLFVYICNISTRYATLLINTLISLVLVPYNLHHLGSSAYGLWMLTASVSAYFSVLDMGYGGAVLKYVSEYKAKKDVKSLNEILSTMFFVYLGLGVLTYAVAIGVSFLLPTFFNLSPEEAHTGQVLLLIIALLVAVHFPFSVYGGVTNAFERYWVNNLVGTVVNVLAAAANVVVLWLGYGLIELVAATTALHLGSHLIYRLNARQAFPELRIRREFFRRAWLRELTGFSVYVSVIDWSSRLTYTSALFVIGHFFNTTAVAGYAVANRCSEALLRLTSQLHTFLFPMVVHRAVEGSPERQRSLMVRATRFQLAVAVAICASVAAVADVLLRAWVGPGFDDSAPVLQILAFVVVVRAWLAMPGNVLKATGHQKYLAISYAWCAVASLLLSITLVKPFGILGVAWSIAIPVVVLAGASVFPHTCRIVGMTAWQGYREIVLPAVAPATVVIALLAATRHAVPPRLLPVLLHMGAGALLYAGLFFLFGLDRQERQWLTAAMVQLKRGIAQRMPAPQVTSL
jgi:O-antigen/teichoic acid export membrane protein